MTLNTVNPSQLLIKICNCIKCVLPIQNLMMTTVHYKIVETHFPTSDNFPARDV